MHTTTLRKVGGSTMVALPPAILEVLQVKIGSTVRMSIEAGRLIIEPERPKYTMASLLAASDYSQPQSAEEREWVDAPTAGDERL